jgi:Arc/MetJ family transcription regulator
MRVHISLDDELLARLDKKVGTRGRSPFIEKLIAQALDDERRWELIMSAAGAISDTGHEWDEDPGEWVRAQRRADPRRVG